MRGDESGGESLGMAGEGGGGRGTGGDRRGADEMEMRGGEGR